MALRFEGLPPDAVWTIQRAEDLLSSLNGVVSVRVVARPGGVIDEIHILTTTDVSPKQTVRNVESALKAHFHLEVDHRKISVAQSTDVVKSSPETEVFPKRKRESEEVVLPSIGERLLFLGHQVETERGRKVKVIVNLDWAGTEFSGEAYGTDLPRSRLETVANATLSAIEAATTVEDQEAPKTGVTLALDGVKVIDAFDRSYVLVGVNAIHQREMAVLAGASPVEDTTERAVILATLQASDRWVRHRV